MGTGKLKITSKTLDLLHLSHSRYDSTDLFRLKTPYSMEAVKSL